MRSIRISTLANYAGQSVAALIGFAAVPLYMRLLGHDGFGMVGFLLVLQNSLAVLDLGLGMAATREIGRHGGATGLREIRDLIRTLEVGYYAMAVTMAAGIMVSAGPLSKRIIEAAAIPQDTINQCLVAAALTVGLRWPVALYSGVLRGRERYVMLNAVISFVAIGKAVVGLLVLTFVSRSVIAFYLVQVAAAYVELALMAAAAWSSARCDASGPPRFRGHMLLRLLRFSIKLSFISACAMLLKQGDRWAVTALLPIDQLGYYTTAVLIGMGIGRVVWPVQSAVFTRLSLHHASGSTGELAATFHRASLCVMAVATPVAATIGGLSTDVLRIWLRAGDPSGVAVAAGAAPLSITAIAMLFNSAMAIPYSLQVAAGWTSLAAWTNATGALLLVPVSIVAVRNWGLTGAAYGWLLFNLLYYAIIPHLVFERLLPESKARWYLKDTLPFIVVGVFLAAVFRMAETLIANGWHRAVFVSGILSAYAAAVLIFLPELRELLFSSQLVRSWMQYFPCRAPRSPK